jgi:hypothetical protein
LPVWEERGEWSKHRGVRDWRKLKEGEREALPKCREEGLHCSRNDGSVKLVWVAARLREGERLYWTKGRIRYRTEQENSPAFRNPILALLLVLDDGKRKRAEG